MVHQYREGLTHVKIELLDECVSVETKSTEGTSTHSYFYSQLSSNPISYKTKDPKIRSMVTLVAMIGFVAWIITGMVRFTINTQSSLVAFVFMVAAIISALLLSPKRQYTIFCLKSGIRAFALKHHSDSGESRLISSKLIENIQRNETQSG